MSAPTRPGAPRSSTRGVALTPRTGVNRVGPPARPGASASSSAASRPRPAIAPAPVRGSFAGVLPWRALVLAGVLGLAFALVWPSLRVYGEQQAHNAALRAERDAAQADVDDLDAELARWKDPAFVVAQARERLAYVYPGETPYRVVDPEVARPAAVGSVDAATEDGPIVQGAWFDRMWASVEAAGAPPQANETAPTEETAPTGGPALTEGTSPSVDQGVTPPTVELGG